MKKFLIYSLLALFVCTLNSCSKDEVFYDFEGTGIAATFAAKSLKVPALTKENNGKVSIPMYRGNVKDAVSVTVEISGGEGVFTPVKTSFDFAAGQNMASLDFTFDYDRLSAKPANLTIEIKNAADIAVNGISATTFTLVRQLTYEKIGAGYYISDFGGDWDQDVYKAKEGDFYLLPSCWVNGTDFSFYCNGTTVDWYTTGSGYNYGSYGPLTFDIKSQTVQMTQSGAPAVVLDVHYRLPEFNNYDLGAGQEVFIFPDGFSFE